MFTVSVPISMYLHASTIPFFNGLNFSNWSEQIQFHLSVLNLDLALRIKKPADLIDKWNINELINMLIQEEMRLRNQRAHSVHFLKHQEAGNNFKKRSGKSKKKGPCKLNDSLKGSHKELMAIKCYFCKNSEHMKKGCL